MGVRHYLLQCPTSIPPPIRIHQILGWVGRISIAGWDVPAQETTFRGCSFSCSKFMFCRSDCSDPPGWSSESPRRSTDRGLEFPGSGFGQQLRLRELGEGLRAIHHGRGEELLAGRHGKSGTKCTEKRTCVSYKRKRFGLPATSGKHCHPAGCPVFHALWKSAVIVACYSVSRANRSKTLQEEVVMLEILGGQR